MTALFSFNISILISFSVFANSSCLTDTKTAYEKSELLRRQGLYLLSLQQYAVITNFACSKEEKALAYLGSAQSLYRLEENFAAEQTLNDLFAIDSLAENKTKGRLLQAWYQPEKQIYLPTSEQKLFFEYNAKALELQNQHQLKKPWLAGLASGLLPGLGQVYNGNYQSAAISFALNSLLLAAALELNKKDLNASALAAGLFFSITYTGNILGSIESARTINRNNTQPYLEEQRQKIIPNLEL